MTKREEPVWRTVHVSKQTLSEKSLHSTLMGDEQIILAMEILRNYFNDKDTGLTVMHTKKDRILVHAIDR
jgi:hypothetical protein